MRMAIGLAALLITIGVIVMIMSMITLPAAKQAIDVKKRVEPQVQQIAGQDTSGRDARQSISLDAETSGGKMTSVLVTAIDGGGAMAKYFGLKRGDSIIEIAPQGEAMTPVKELDSPATAKDTLLSAYQNSQHIVVIRDGQKLTLPVPPPGKPKPGAAPAASSQAGSNPLQQQIDAIGNVPGQ
jgi:hypothetical protein